MPVVIFTGTTGIDMRRICETVRQEFGDAEIIDIQRKIEYCLDVRHYKIYGYAFYKSPYRIREACRETVKDVISEIEGLEKDGKTVILTGHITYLQEGLFIVSPVIIEILKEIMRLEEKVNKKIIKGAIFFVDDYYHALLRMLKKAETEPFDEEIDPLTYLQWRGVDLANFITLFFLRGIDSYLAPIKHSKETIIGLIEHILGRRRRKCIYLAHHIRVARKMAIESHKNLSEVDYVKEYEQFKEDLSRESSLLLFEPATIDELIYDPRTEDLRTEIREAERWPFKAHATIHNDFILPVDLTTTRWESLYDPRLLNESWYLSLMKEHINKQIDMRDSLLIEQSRCLVAYRPTALGGLSSGVARETNMAIDKGKPVLWYIPEGCGADEITEAEKTAGVRPFERAFKRGRVVVVRNKEELLSRL